MRPSEWGEEGRTATAVMISNCLEVTSVKIRLRSPSPAGGTSFLIGVIESVEVSHETKVRCSSVSRPEPSASLRISLNVSSVTPTKSCGGGGYVARRVVMRCSDVMVCDGKVIVLVG